MKNWSFEKLGRAMNIGLPIFLFILAIGSFIWSVYEIRKKRINLKSLIVWLTWNILYTIAITYVLIVTILHIAHVENVPNIFNQLAHYAFGIDMQNGKQWVILLILSFIAFILILTLRNSINISKQEARLDKLNKQVAILMGQVNRTTDFDNLPLATKQKNAKEIKQELREKIKIQKAKIKAEKRMQLLSQNATKNPKKKKK